MWNYALYAAFMCYIAYWIISVARQRIIHEIYEACGLGCFFSILFLSNWQPGPGILPLRVTGFVLYIPAIVFLVSAFATLRIKGKPKDAWEQTTVIIDSGVFRVVRHPLFLGTVIWAVGLMLVFQSTLAIVLGAATVFCCFVASRKEDQFNSNKFGDEYRSYCNKVPMWNFIKGMWNLRKHE